MTGFLTSSQITLRENMTRTYIEAVVRLHVGTMNTSMYISRRNHARRTLLERCGYTQETMTILHGRAMRQAEAAAMAAGL